MTLLKHEVPVMVCDQCGARAMPGDREVLATWFKYGTLDPFNRAGGTVTYHACGECGIPHEYLVAEARERNMTVEELEAELEANRRPSTINGLRHSADPD